MCEIKLIIPLQFDLKPVPGKQVERKVLSRHPYFSRMTIDEVTAITRSLGVHIDLNEFNHDELVRFYRAFGNLPGIS